MRPRHDVPMAKPRPALKPLKRGLRADAQAVVVDARQTDGNGAARGPPVGRDEWYKAADAGYNYRDQMVPEHFAKMVGLYQVFVAMLVGFGAWVAGQADAGHGSLLPAAPWVAGLLGFMGLACMLALHIDLCSTLSAKYALEEFRQKLERGEPTAGGPQAAIEGRPTYRMEAMKYFLIGGWGKALDCLRRKRARRTQFVVVSLLLLLLWVVTCLAVLWWLTTLHGAPANAAAPTP